jgi:hypothetical protein
MAFCNQNTTSLWEKNYHNIGFFKIGENGDHNSDPDGLCFIYNFFLGGAVKAIFSTLKHILSVAMFFQKVPESNPGNIT